MAADGAGRSPGGATGAFHIRGGRRGVGVAHWLLLNGGGGFLVAGWLYHGVCAEFLADFELVLGELQNENI